MQFAWNDDEGLDLEWRRIKERYGVEASYEKAASELLARIQTLRNEKSRVASANEERRRRIDSLEKENATQEAHIKDRAEFLAVQKAYYEIEKRPDYFSQIQQAERAIEAGKQAIQKNEASLLDLRSVGEESYDSSELERCVKALSAIDGNSHYSYRSDLLVPKRVSARQALPVATCIALLKNCRVDISDILYFDGEVVLTEDEYPKKEWDELAKEAAELSPWLSGEKKCVSANGRVFSWIGKSLIVKIEGYRFDGVQDDPRLRLAFLSSQKSTSHPLFTQFSVRLPHDFVLYSDSTWIEFHFACAAFGMTSAILNIDDDYNE